MIKHKDDKLTKEEELELGRKIQKMNVILESKPEDKRTKEDKKIILDGEEALSLLVSNYINLARSITHKMHSKTGTKYDIEDLMQDAISALIESAKDYNPEKNCKLGTYAYYGITKRVSSSINYQRLVRMPENKMGDYIKITDAQKEYNLLKEEEKSKFRNELDYVYKTAGLKKSEVDLILENMQPQVYLNSSSPSFEGTELIDILADERKDEMKERVEGLDPEVERIIQELTPFQRDLVAYEFGVFSPSVQYSEFLSINDLDDKKVKNLTRKTITVMTNLAKKMNISVNF